MRTGLTGGSFGDNFVAAIPDIIGQAVGGVRNATREAARYNAGAQRELNTRTQATRDRLDDTLDAIGNAQGSHVTDAATDALYTSANATVEAEAKQAAIASEKRLSTIEVNDTRANYDDLVSNIEGLNLLIGAYNRAEEQRAAGFNRRQDAIAARVEAIRARQLRGAAAERAVGLDGTGSGNAAFEQGLADVAAARAQLEATAGARDTLNGAIEQGQQRLVEGLSFAPGPVGAAANGVLTIGSAANGTLTPLDVLPNSRIRRLQKPINLPSARSVNIDMSEIISGHTAGGSRVTSNSRKDLFPDWMSNREIERTVRDAYSKSRRIRSQGDRVLVRGSSDGLPQKHIDIWVNTKTKTIETAYPGG